MRGARMIPDLASYRVRLTTTQYCHLLVLWLHRFGYPLAMGFC